MMPEPMQSPGFAPRILKIADQRLARETRPFVTWISQMPPWRLAGAGLTLRNVVCSPTRRVRSVETNFRVAELAPECRRFGHTRKPQRTDRSAWEWRNQNPLPYRLATPPAPTEATDITSASG